MGALADAGSRSQLYGLHMWVELGSFVLGLAGGLAATFIEPVNRWLGRVGRRTARDRGVAVHVETDPSVIWAGTPDWVPFQYFFPAGELPVPPPPNPRKWRSWAIAQGGFDLWESVVRLTIVGTAPVTVVLETPDLTVTTEPLPPGRKVLRPVGGADISPRAYRVDLDTFGDQNPDISLVEQGDSVRHDPLSFSLERNEVQQILLRVQSQRPCLFSWKARLPILIDGKREYVDIDDGGLPFRLAGGDLLDTSLWEDAQWVPREL